MHIGGKQLARLLPLIASSLTVAGCVPTSLVSSANPASAIAQPIVPNAPRADPWAQVSSAVEAARAETGFPAVVVAVARGPQLVYNEAFGVTDLENGTRAKAESVFRIASVSKPITATAVLQLVEEGSLNLQSSIRRYVPSLPSRYQKITIADLLRHTGGVRHYKSEAEYVTTRHCDRLADAVSIFASDPLDHRPGDKITYSTWGYVLLGLAVERASGLRFADYVRARIFAPAAMKSTRLDTLELITHRAEGYTHENGKIRNADPIDTSCRIPAGGFVSTAADLARFAIALQNGRLVRRDTALNMMRSQITRAMIDRTVAGSELPSDYNLPTIGYGWSIVEEDFGTVVNHGGNQPGVTAMLYLVPERGLSVAILTNLDGEGAAITELAKTIVKAVPSQP